MPFILFLALGTISQSSGDPIAQTERPMIPTCKDMDSMDPEALQS